MNKPLLGKKIAVLVANGFAERDLTHTQKRMSGTGANMRIISMDHGLVNSWTSEGWGLHFAADQVLSQALAADFDILIIPGGHRSIEKLSLTAHTRRFLGGFVDTGKPVVLFNEAVSLMVFANKAEGRKLAGPLAYASAITEAEGDYTDSPCVISDNVLTGNCTKETRAEFVESVYNFLMNMSDTTDDEKVLQPVAA
ncbi:MAG: DJ-1/PfpI family protein [Alphaproteobacteria bacterium]|nr:DJ-1/PfpI family protein [Alphaproteobacteria bacterium]